MSPSLRAELDRDAVGRVDRWNRVRLALGQLPLTEPSPGKRFGGLKKLSKFLCRWVQVVIR